MHFEELVELIGDEPVFESTLLLAGEVSPAAIRLQLSRWVKSGRLIQLRRGLYTLAPPYRKVKAHPFVIANRLRRSSYVSLQAALAYHQLIPEYTPVVTSVTGGRPGIWDTPMARFEFRHIKPALFGGYRLTELGGGQQAFVAEPEKALLDMLYLEPGSDNPAYLQELRLQNTERLDGAKMAVLAAKAGSPRLSRAVERMRRLLVAPDVWEAL
jgi:hypothetical protein